MRGENNTLLLTAPAVGPLSLAEAFLRVETGEDNAIVTSLIAGRSLYSPY